MGLITRFSLLQAEQILWTTVKRYALTHAKTVMAKRISHCQPNMLRLGFTGHIVKRHARGGVNRAKDKCCGAAIQTWRLAGWGKLTVENLH